VTNINHHGNDANVANDVKEASFYKLPKNNINNINNINDIIECELCPHYCKILPSKTGICMARRNQNGRLTAENHGKVTSIALDPIEKKPLYHFYPGSKILSVGSYGCNFHCGFCQNHRISMQKSSYREFSPENIAEISKEYITQGNIGAAYTYNEPLIGYEFVKDCARLIQSQEQKNVLVTNGFINPKPLELLLPFIDALNIDLKSFSSSFYKEISGVLNALEDVKRTINMAVSNCHVEITTLVLPHENDSVEEMESLSGWIADINTDIPLHITRFFPAYKMFNTKPTPVETIYKLVETARRNLRYVYHGNC